MRTSHLALLVNYDSVVRLDEAHDDFVNRVNDPPETRLSKAVDDGDFGPDGGVEQIAPGVLIINNNESADKS